MLHLFSLLALLLLVGGCSLWSKEPPPPPAEPRYEAGRRVLTPTEYWKIDEQQFLAVPLRFKGGAVFYERHQRYWPYLAYVEDDREHSIKLVPEGGLALADYLFIREHCDVSSRFRDPRADSLPEACRLTHLDVRAIAGHQTWIEALVWAVPHEERVEAVLQFDLELMLAYGDLSPGKRIRLGPLAAGMDSGGESLLLSEPGRSYGFGEGMELPLADFAPADRRALLRRCPPVAENRRPHCRLDSLELTLGPSEARDFVGRNIVLDWGELPPQERAARDIYEDLLAEPERLLGQEVEAPVTEVRVINGAFFLAGPTYRLFMAVRNMKEGVGEELLRRGCASVLLEDRDVRCAATEVRFRVGPPRGDYSFSAEGLSIRWKKGVEWQAAKSDPLGLPRLDLVDLEVEGLRYRGQRVRLDVAGLKVDESAVSLLRLDAAEVHFDWWEPISTLAPHDRVRAVRHCMIPYGRPLPSLCRLGRLTAVVGGEAEQVRLLPGSVEIGWIEAAPPAPGASQGLVDWAALHGEREHFAGRRIRLSAERLKLTGWEKKEFLIEAVPGRDVLAGFHPLSRLAKEDRKRARTCGWRGCRIEWIEVEVGYDERGLPVFSGKDLRVGWR